MNKINPNQLFTYISRLGQTNQNGQSQSLLTTDGKPLQEIIPHHTWSQFDNNFFESKTVEELRNFNTGLVFLKASYPNARDTVNDIYTISSSLLGEKSATQVNRSASSEPTSSVILKKQPAKAQRKERLKAHQERQFHIAETYASYVGKTFVPQIEARTNRLVRPEEYLARQAKLLSGETFEMIMNYYLEEPEVAERVELAHSKAQEQGRVIKSDCQEALLKGARAFQGEIFEMYANVLMSEPK